MKSQWPIEYAHGLGSLACVRACVRACQGLNCILSRNIGAKNLILLAHLLLLLLSSVAIYHRGLGVDVCLLLRRRLLRRCLLLLLQTLRRLLRMPLLLRGKAWLLLLLLLLRGFRLGF